jgi:prepilin-type N-terminal cleavage/methylation domain-containing protein
MDIVRGFGHPVPQDPSVPASTGHWGTGDLGTQMRKTRAFTLIEVLVALVILGLGIVLALNLFLSAWQSFYYSRKLNDVNYLAQKKIEELKAEELNLRAQKASGTDNDLNWSIWVSPMVLEQGIQVMHVQIDVEFKVKGVSQTKRFVTYF